METSFFSYFLTALGIACILEALPWLIAPRKMINFILELAETVDPEKLRYWGIFLLLLALIFIWLGRRVFTMG